MFRLLNVPALNRVAQCLATLAVGCLAWSVQASGLEQLRQFSSTMRTAKGEFTQQVLRAGRKPQQSQGNFAFARPGKFQWNYAHPYEQVLVADGEKLFIYDKDLNQVTVRKLGDALGSSPAAILFGNQNLETLFNLKELPDYKRIDGRSEGRTDGLEWVEAIPKNKESNFEKVRIGWRDNAPQAMELVDAFGQTTVLGFQKFERNPALSVELFRFVPPKGADVLQQ